MTMSARINVNRIAANTLPTIVLTDSSENTIATEVIAGNAALEELGALFREHYKGIFRVAYRITGSQSDAEDVLQTIFVRLTPGWADRDLSPNPRAFLYRAAINASLDIVRHRKRANSVSLDVIDFDQSSTAPSPADDLVDMELRELVR